MRTTTNGNWPLVVLSSVAMLCVTMASRQKPVFMNQFAVHVPGGRERVDAIAEKHGFDNLGQIGSLKDYYLLEHKRIHKRSLDKSDYHHEQLSKDPHVHWFEQQAEKKRKKRDFTSSGFDSFPSEFSSLFGGQTSHHKTFRSLTAFVDPLFKEEWYLNGGAKDGYDMNIGPAWTKGYTGKGVVVSILDDGIQTNHPDLAQNYDPAASTDINGNDDDPMPRDNGDNKHGTRCAGEVAAVANNAFCGVGVAYNASIGGVRMLDGSVNDAVEARALSLNPDHIDIYSASWGPEDDGKTVDGPGPLARRAFINGVTTGRKGKGSIFVWASGNGGRHTDSCNCDGYTNSIFTLSISSATQGGYKPWYLEECSSTLATTYSSGTPGHDKSIATVDMDGQLRPDHICTVEHTGTSASAPLASGLCALALEANPELTWRDMQHIVVMTSNPQPLMKENGWITNGVNRKVSHKFGYGLMDGGAMVALAEQWTVVPPQHICKSPEVNDDRPIDPSYGSVFTTTVDASGCPGSVNEVRYVEHVQCKVSLRFFPRGNLRLILTSPSGTPSTLLMERPRDVVASNFDDWPFLSVHYWGENPKGRWTLQVINAGNRHVNQAGILRKWQLIFYGTATNPVRLKPAGGVRPSSFFPSPSQQPALAPFFQGVTTSDIFSNPSFKVFPNLFSGQGSEIDNSKVPLDGSSIQYNELAEGAACHESCGTCAGPSLDSCLTCAKGLLYVTDLGLCLQKCPDGYYEDSATNSCIGCHGNCASCPEAPSLCSSCDHHLILYNGTCVASCPKQTYETDDYRCRECDPSCETCVRGGPDGCVTCPNGDQASVTGHCAGADFCPNSHCTRCTGKDGENVCIECNRGFLLDPSGVCLPDPNIECRPGEYMTNQGCQPCMDTSNCTRCPQALNILNNTCVVSCGRGYFSDSGWCQRCAQNCVECLGERGDQCLTCVDGYKISPYGSCLASCPSDTYTADWGCVKCHHFCSSCSGEGPYACTSCTSGRYLDAASKLCMPCVPCDPNNQHQCCHCDPTTGKCHLPAGKRRITSEQAARAHEDELIAEASMTASNRVSAHGRGPQYASLTVAAIVSCATVILVFGIVIFVVQMKTRDSSRRGYTKVPIREMRFSSFVEPHKQSRIRFTQIAQNDLEYDDDDDDDEHVILTAAKS